MICDFTSNLSRGLIPLSVNFTGWSDGAPTSWLWNFGDDQTSTLQNPNHIYTQVGYRTVTLEIRASNNQYAVKKAANYILGHPGAIAVKFQNRVYGSGNLNQITFNFGDGTSVVTTAPFISHTYPSIGDYTATIQALSMDGATSSQSWKVPVRATASDPTQYFSIGSTWGMLPDKPSNLRGSTTFSNKVRLDWTDNAFNETGFKIERSSDSTVYSQIVLSGLDSTRYENTGLSAGALYWYRIRAYNANGDSSYSNDCTGRTL